METDMKRQMSEERAKQQQAQERESARMRSASEAREREHRERRETQERERRQRNEEQRESALAAGHHVGAPQSKADEAGRVLYTCALAGSLCARWPGMRTPPPGMRAHAHAHGPGMQVFTWIDVVRRKTNRTKEEDSQLTKYAFFFAALGGQSLGC